MKKHWLRGENAIIKDICCGILVENVLHMLTLWNICLLMQRPVAVFHVAFVELFKTVLLCLPETTAWSNKEQRIGRHEKE